MNNTSSTIVYCTNFDSNCLGGKSSDPKEACLKGHKGALCEVK